MKKVKSIKIIKYLLATVFVVLIVILLALVVKGKAGNPFYYQTSQTRNTKVGSPFESSGSTSRYALTEAIVEDNTFFFNEDRARFSAPDMVEYNGKFFSIFTPGVSFIGVPFYLIGKSLLEQKQGDDHTLWEISKSTKILNSKIA